MVDVGATDLTVNNDQFTIASGADTGTYAADSYNSEVGWSNPAAGVSLNTNTGGSSGGYALFPTPTYQQGLVIRQKSNPFERWRAYHPGCFPCWRERYIEIPV